MKKTIITVFCFLLFYTISHAAPEITSVGSVTDGQPTTITGTSFGTKTIAEPVLWDDFEAGINGNEIAGTTPDIAPGEWLERVDSSTFSNTENRTGSTLNSDHTIYANSLEDKNTQQLITQLYQLDASEKFYYTVWSRFNMSWTGTPQGQIKQMAVMSNHPPGGTEFDTVINWHYINDHSEWQNWIETVEDYNINFNPDTAEDTWYRYEFQVQMNSAPGVTDGLIQMNITQASFAGPILNQGDYSDAVFLEDNGDAFNEIWLRAWIGNATLFPRSANIKYDDIYFDNSWSRIEIGDNATYANCTHREIQIPTVWSDTGITFTANQASFTTGVTYYLFILNEDGVYNTTGEPIVFGEGPDPSITGGTNISPGANIQ